MQKLFEGTGSSFTHYIRERRLQRTWADLSNPAQAHHSISEIAFRSGFITAEQLYAAGKAQEKSGYGQYLLALNESEGRLG